eukprot:286916-Pyramimonas_sp.AAC.1
MVCRHSRRGDLQALLLGLCVVLPVGHIPRGGSAAMGGGRRYANLVSGAVGGALWRARSVREVFRSRRGGEMRSLSLRQ